jgi:peroxiredoxin (alkyl hydroperoxide reductase subunit C)
MSVLVGKKAPVFKAPAVIDGNTIVENFSLEEYLGKKYVVFFFYPADFTFVCPTELHAFQEKLGEFESRNTVVVACSTDSAVSHWKWLQTPKKEGGINGVTYPVVADHALTISMAYDVLAGEFDSDETTGDPLFVGSPEAYRGLFLIDKSGPSPGGERHAASPGGERHAAGQKRRRDIESHRRPPVYRRVWRGMSRQLAQR